MLRSAPRAPAAIRAAAIRAPAAMTMADGIATSAITSALGVSPPQRGIVAGRTIPPPWPEEIMEPVLWLCTAPGVELWLPTKIEEAEVYAPEARLQGPAAYRAPILSASALAAGSTELSPAHGQRIPLLPATPEALDLQ